MHKKYIELFKELAQSTAVSAERDMDYDAEKDDKEGYATAQMMRDQFEELKARIDEAKENYELTKTDAAKLTVGAMIAVNQIQDRINALKRAMTGYQTELIPRLQEIVDKAEDDNEAIRMANEKFVLDDKE